MQERTDVSLISYEKDSLIVARTRAKATDFKFGMHAHMPAEKISEWGMVT